MFNPIVLILFTAGLSLGNPISPPVLPDDTMTTDESSNKSIDLRIGSSDYSKGQMASVLLNALFEYGIDSGSIGGDSLPCPSESDGLLEDPFACEYYFHCTGGISTRVKCPEKLAFDNVTKTCVPAESVSECSAFVKDSEYKCQFNGLHIYPKDCSKYYICVNKVAYITKCPNDYHFDHALRFCIEKEQALCLPENSVPVIV